MLAFAIALGATVPLGAALWSQSRQGSERRELDSLEAKLELYQHPLIESKARLISSLRPERQKIPEVSPNQRFESTWHAWHPSCDDTSHHTDLLTQ